MKVLRTQLLSPLLLLCVTGSVLWAHPSGSVGDPLDGLQEELECALITSILEAWYPRVVDAEQGGYWSQFDADWKRLPDQPKMVVTQARHIWTSIRLYERFSERDELRQIASHGVDYLLGTMWDSEKGGFFWLLDEQGNVLEQGRVGSRKQSYGIAFAIYALAAYHEVTGDARALDGAVRTFRWLDSHAHDARYGGYFDIMGANGAPYVNPENRVYAKSQNTSIHLLEAFTELFRVWPDEQLRLRLVELQELLMHRMIDARGYVNQYFHEDWTPVSFEHHALDRYREVMHWDHVSFGHDVEIAYLLYESELALGGEKLPEIRQLGKKLLDHALMHGWDAQNGGLYDAGLYRDGRMHLVSKHKAWWAQAELLNTLLMMHCFEPEDAHAYDQLARRTWDYISTWLIDHERGGWYAQGLDQSPEAANGLKSQIWKGAYHNSRALLNASHWLECAEQR